MDDVRFSAFLCIHMTMSDEQISDRIINAERLKQASRKWFIHKTRKTYVNIVVSNRNQIAQIIRDLRMHFGFLTD